MTEKEDKLGQKRTNDAKRGRKLDDFVLAVMSHPTLEAAAEALGITPRTVRRWIQEPEVRERLRGARKDVMNRSLVRLQQSTCEAVDCLVAVLKGESESARVAAARCILEQALRATELNDVQERLDQLERVAKSRNWEGATDHDQPTTATEGNRKTNGVG